MFFNKTHLVSIMVLTLGGLFWQTLSGSPSPIDSPSQTSVIQTQYTSTTADIGESTELQSAVGNPEFEIVETDTLWSLIEKFEFNVRPEPPTKSGRFSNKPRRTKNPRLVKLIELIELSSLKAANDSVQSKSEDENRYYQVELGDTVSAIAQKSGIDVDILLLMNNIGSEESLFAGQEIFIPNESELQTAISRELHWPFDYQELPFVVTQHFHDDHQGIDFALPTGVPIRAATSGVVTFANWDPIGYGNMVLIYHGGDLYTLYAHLDSLKVEAGQNVKLGQVLGYSGNSGNSSNPHLHFEILNGFESLNPCFHIVERCED